MRHELGVMPVFSKEELSRDELRDITKYVKAWKVIEICLKQTENRYMERRICH